MNTTKTLGLFDYVGTESEGLADVTPWLRALRDSGWSTERLAKNELPVEVIGERYYDYTYEEFWHTLGELTAAVAAIGLDPIFIKSKREYRYFDSNADVVVPAEAWDRTVAHLSTQHWTPPTGRDKIEQGILEKRKLKLSSQTAGVLPAHMYGGVSWGYQQDTGLLRDAHGRPDEAQLERVRLTGAHDGTFFFHPKGAAELVLQGAHIVFENFRMTLGEAAHIALLLERHPDLWEPALDLAERVGCTQAVKLVAAESRGILSRLPEIPPERFPLPLPKDQLKAAFAERWQHLRRGGATREALVELSTSRGFLTIRGAVRAVRRWRRGHEDRRY